MTKLEIFESSTLQSSEERIETSQFSMMIFKHETRSQIGEGLICTQNTCVRR